MTQPRSPLESDHLWNWIFLRCSQLDVGAVNINKATILVLQFQIPNEKFQLMITLISVKIQLRKPTIFGFIKKDGMW